MSAQVSTDRIAELVLDNVGGRDNVLSNSLCMTRLRLRLADPEAVDTASLEEIPGVLGLAARGSNGIEVVFGPRLINEVYNSFVSLTGRRPEDADIVVGTTPLPSSLKVQISSSRNTIVPDATSADALSNQPASDDDLSDLAKLDDLDDQQESVAPDSEVGPERSNAAPSPSSDARDGGLRLLVINGPNINMVGIREPDIYGVETYDDILVTCKKAAADAGFAECSCFQSNHEGDIVDRIQDAYQVYDGIVINPGAYTHTSVAILDALKAVSIPTVEVHISEVDKREKFRQVSYVRQACFETVMGMGISGYRKAILDLYAYLAE